MVSDRRRASLWRDREALYLSIRDFTDYEIAQTMFTFLFSSQDATAALQLGCSRSLLTRPEVLDRIREENLQVRGGDRNKPITIDLAGSDDLHWCCRERIIEIPTSSHYGSIHGSERIPHQ